ncbi:MAG: endonuclease III [Vicinamibacterales bacterium]
MKSATETITIFDLLDEQHPGADTELHYSNAYELLAATILSAQSTDQRVNMVTPALFKRYPTPAALAKATAEELEPQIHSTGFFRAKSRALIGMATALIDKHGGEVPPDMDALTALPGVGRKTANVVLGHALGIPGLPVDRHVLRVSNRIGLAEGDDAEKVEAQLCAVVPTERWTRASDCLILHGRRVCKPKPLCEQCLVRDHCDYYRTGETTDPRKRTQASARTRGTAASAQRKTTARATRTAAARPTLVKPRKQGK